MIVSLLPKICFRLFSLRKRPPASEIQARLNIDYDAAPLASKIENVTYGIINKNTRLGFGEHRFRDQ